MLRPPPFSPPGANLAPSISIPFINKFKSVTAAFSVRKAAANAEAPWGYVHMHMDSECVTLICTHRWPDFVSSEVDVLEHLFVRGGKNAECVYLVCVYRAYALVFHPRVYEGGVPGCSG